MWKQKAAWWHVGRGRARADAADMLITYGDLACEVARRLARADRRGRVVDLTLPPGHWDRVVLEIDRQSARAARQTVAPEPG